MTLDTARVEAKKKQKRKVGIVLGIFSLYLSPYIASLLIQWIELKMQIRNVITFDYITNFCGAFRKENIQQLGLTMMLYMVTLYGIYKLLTYKGHSIEKQEFVQITNRISIPKPVPNGSFGNDWFASEENKKKQFFEWKYNPNDYEDIGGINVGVVVEMIREKDYDRIKCVVEDVHTLLIGITRWGKGRRVLYQTMWLRIIARMSFINIDPKKEAYLFLKKWLEKFRFNVWTFDTIDTNKSDHYNFMYFVNEAVKEGDIPKAIDYIWDMVSILVEKDKGEAIWRDGTSCVLATAMCILALEAPEEYKNLPNVHHFIGTMFEEDEYGEMYIDKYMKTLPIDHPARELFYVVKISPDKTRMSFVSQALTLLKDFTNQNIAEMTSKTDYNLRNICKKPTALFILVNDEKETYYKFANLFVRQAYTAMTEEARKSGGRLKMPVDIFWDEFGNYPYIPGFASWLTVSAGRGIRFLLSVQDDQQIEAVYKDAYKTITGNCAITVYLGTGQPDTIKRIKDKLGYYTMRDASASESVSGTKEINVSSSSSISHKGRKLLEEYDLGKFKKPYGLIINTSEDASIVNLPDLSEYFANDDLGLGSKAHNLKIMKIREEERPSRKIIRPKYWQLRESLLSEESTEEEIEYDSYIS